MRVLICGDRDWNDPDIIDAIVRGLHEIAITKDKELEVVEGKARGADRMAESSAYNVERNIHGELGFSPRIKVLDFPAKWDEFGNAAGPIRNREMLKADPDVIIAFHSDISASKGTKDMINIAVEAGKPVLLVQQIEKEIK